MVRPRFLPLIIALCALIFAPPPQPSSAQLADLIAIEVDQAGFGGLYRSDSWFPLKVRLINRGADFSGRIVIRPESTAAGIRDTYSVSVPDLPRPIAPSTETVQTAFLYGVADGGDVTLRVELIDDNGRVVASTDAFMRDVAPRDGLYAVIPPQTAVNLADVTPANANALQIGWALSDIPDRPGGLWALDAVVIGTVDTGTLTAAQTAALRAWVQGGGHLIVTGANTQNVAGLGDLLPFEPGGTATIDDFDALVRLAGRNGETLTGETLISEGTLVNGGRVLARSADDTPLIVRREFGHGTVDYLTFSPDLAPFNRWPGLSDLWFTLLTSTQAAPGWAFGFRDWTQAQNAVEILPGIDLLPSAWSLIAFLGLYILLIGPLNYYILSRINRRGYAWVTIPAFIVIFSVLAYTVGFELRGNVVTLSRLSVVQAWPDSDEAQVDQLVGLLAPRRGNYTLALDDARLLRPFGRTVGIAGIGTRTANIEIRQFENFEAVDFPVDASFLAGFSTVGQTERPALSGAVTVIIDDAGNPTLRGFVRNDTGLVIQEPMLITASVMHPLAATLTGGLTNFDTGYLNLAVREPAVASSLEQGRGGLPITGITGAVGRGSRTVQYGQGNIEALMSNHNDTSIFTWERLEDNDREIARRRAFLESFIRDEFFSTGRGERVYLVGWADEPILSERVTNELLRQINTTLYIIELEAEYVTAGGARRIVTQDKFSWVSIERDTILETGPANLQTFADVRLGFRFTPQPGAVLDRVDELAVILERSSTARIGGFIELWDWDAGEWQVIRFEDETRLPIDDHERFIGPLNAVQIRTVPRMDDEGGTPTLARIGIEQVGR